MEEKLLGRANPERRQAFVEQIQDLLAGARHDRHLLVYLDEAHIHQDADLGYGWSERGRRLWIASPSPRLSDKLSFYGLYLYNTRGPEALAYQRTGPPFARRSRPALARRSAPPNVQPQPRP